MVDNFNQIKSIIDGCGADEFYMLQVIHRSKDGKTKFEPKDRNIGTQTIKTYFVSSPEYLDYKMEEIKTLCEIFNARAYINLNKKSWKQVSLKSLEILAHNISTEEFKKSKSLFESACGQTGACDKDKTWIVDVDSKDIDEIEEIKNAISKCEPFDVEKIKAVIPTQQGYHIISRPFNKNKFRQIYTKQIDIHDNNPTLLYKS